MRKYVVVHTIIKKLKAALFLREIGSGKSKTELQF
jgi:hypothetical protein